MIQTIVLIILLINFIYLGNLIYKVLTRKQIERKLYNGEDTKHLVRNGYMKYALLVVVFVLGGIVVNMMW